MQRTCFIIHHAPVLEKNKNHPRCYNTMQSTRNFKFFCTSYVVDEGGDRRTIKTTVGQGSVNAGKHYNPQNRNMENEYFVDS